MNGGSPDEVATVRPNARNPFARSFRGGGNSFMDYFQFPDTQVDANFDTPNPYHSSEFKIVLCKNRYCTQNSKFWPKKSKICPKIENLGKNLKCGQQIESLVKNRDFCHKSKF